jgi:hypothetical protein
MRILIVLFLASTVGAANAAGETAGQQFEYRGLCEASGAAALDDSHFAVASDETNVIQIYKRGDRDTKGELDVETLTTFDKSDIEGAARIGSRVYWISSHSLNKEGKDRPKRKVLFATDIIAGAGGGAPMLKTVGKPYTELRDALIAAAGVARETLNIEALAATGDGGLLIGLRTPLVDGKAIVLQLKNPKEIIEATAAAPVAPSFGKAVPLKLDGFGIRSIERVGTGDRQFLISAGPEQDSAEPFRLYWWSGRDGDPPKPVGVGINLDGIKPEALISFGDATRFLVLSDDDDICSDEKAPEKRRFRAREIVIP